MRLPCDRFVQRLRQRALSHPNITVIEATVTKILEKDGKVIGVEYKEPIKPAASLDGGDMKTPAILRSMYAPLTVVADGLWSGFRKDVDKKAKPVLFSTFVGLILEHPPMESPLPHRGYGHVVLVEPSPVLLYQISSTETRVLVSLLYVYVHARSVERMIYAFRVSSCIESVQYKYYP